MLVKFLVDNCHGIDALLAELLCSREPAPIVLNPYTSGRWGFRVILDTGIENVFGSKMHVSAQKAFLNQDNAIYVSENAFL